MTTVLGVPEERAGAYHRFALFLKLWYLRRYAAKLIYELEHLHAGGPDAAGAYARLLAAALKIKILDIGENRLKNTKNWPFVDRLKACEKDQGSAPV